MQVVNDRIYDLAQNQSNPLYIPKTKFLQLCPYQHLHNSTFNGVTLISSFVHRCPQCLLVDTSSLHHHVIFYSYHYTLSTLFFGRGAGWHRTDPEKQYTPGYISRSRELDISILFYTPYSKQDFLLLSVRRSNLRSLRCLLGLGALPRVDLGGSGFGLRLLGVFIWARSGKASGCIHPGVGKTSRYRKMNGNGNVASGIEWPGITDNAFRAKEASGRVMIIFQSGSLVFSNLPEAAHLIFWEALLTTFCPLSIK